MGEKFPLIDLVFLGLATGFLIYKLYQVLGRRTDQDIERTSSKEDGLKKSITQKAAHFFTAAPPPATVPIPEKDFDFPAPQTLSEGFAQIKTADPTFDPSQFLRGAREAFRLIVSAFSVGDLEAIRPLVSLEVHAAFSTSVQERKSAGLTAHTTLVQIADADFKDARMEGNIARIKVEISSDQIYVLRDSEGQVREGRPEKVTRIVDVWTFQKNMRPNESQWILIATNVG